MNADQRLKQVIGDLVVRNVALEQALAEGVQKATELTQEMARALAEAGYMTAAEYVRLSQDRKWEPAKAE